MVNGMSGIGIGAAGRATASGAGTDAAAIAAGAAGAIGLGRRQIDVEGVGQFAVSDGAPQLVEQPLRQANIDAGDQNLSTQRFQLADATEQLFLIQFFIHKS